MWRKEDKNQRKIKTEGRKILKDRKIETVILIFLIGFIVVLVIYGLGRQFITINAKGVVESVQDITLYAKTNGIIEQVLVDEGNEVEKEQELVLFDLTDAEINLQLAENKFEEAKVNLREAERKLEISNRLFKRGFEAYQSLRDKYDQYARAKAQKKQAYMAYKLAKSQWNKLMVRSPLNGVVIAKHVKDKEPVTFGQPLITVAKTDEIKISAYVSEADMSYLKIGQRAKIVLVAEEVPQREAEGYITEIAPKAEDVNGNRVVKATIKLNENPGFFMIGNQVDIKIIVGPTKAFRFLSFK